MSENIYESPKLLAEYLLLHYGSAAEILGDGPGPTAAIGFPTRLVRELLAPVAAESRALDLGCAVGGSSFELARTCAEVVGIDYSQAFIAAANHLRSGGTHAYEKAVEGDLIEQGIARVPEGIDRTRVTFEQGDAMDFPNPESKIQNPKSFDVVLAANLLCRLPEPLRLIERLPALVKSGGQLLLTTPFTWLEEFTPKAHWIGGTAATGRSFDALRVLLEPHFELEHVIDLPFLIREHVRKFQFGIACGSRWRRR
ncbi:MAG TPA: putative 4-mercaptohistidine N1-methyltransferase [Chthoniobacterales bacterium]